MTPESDFHIYLTSRSSLDEYSKNTSSKFTNRLNPSLLFNNSQEWEVGLVSLILPFKTDYIQFNSNIKYDVKIKKKWFEKTSDEEGDNIQIYDIEKSISILPSDLITLGSKKIFTIFIKKIAVAIDIKSQILESFFLIYEKDHLVIKSHFNNKPVHESLKNLLFLEITFNIYAKNIFGIDNDTFILYDVQNESKINSIIGSKKIDLKLTHPNYILIYTDIVTTTQYGSQNISLLDVLPFGKSYTNNRKNTYISYKGLIKNNISDISIIITDPGHDILNTYSEDCLICLHFRKKNKDIIQLRHNLVTLDICL